VARVKSYIILQFPLSIGKAHRLETAVAYSGCRTAGSFVRALDEPTRTGDSHLEKREGASGKGSLRHASFTIPPSHTHTNAPVLVRKGGTFPCADVREEIQKSKRSHIPSSTSHITFVFIIGSVHLK